MFRKRHFDHVRELFADQFEAEGAGYLYRKSGKGAAIRVSAVERETFIAVFNRRLRYATWSISITTVLLIVLIVLLFPDVESGLSDAAIYAGVGCIAVVFYATYYWAWNEPTRALERRTPVQQALSREEARRVGLSKISYGQLGLAVLFAIYLVWVQSAEQDVFHGWGILWLVFAGVLIVISGVQAFRKWRAERLD